MSICMCIYIYIYLKAPIENQTEYEMRVANRTKRALKAWSNRDRKA